MINIILTAAVCLHPIPLGATPSEIQAADCEFFTKAYTTSHKECDMVRDAFLRSFGKVRGYGYLSCAWDQEGPDPKGNYINVPRVDFNSKKGI